MSRIYSHFKSLSQHSFRGNAVLIHKTMSNIPRRIIVNSQIPKEIQRFKSALDVVIFDLKKVSSSEINTELQELIEFQIKILQGSSFTRGITKLIEQANLNAEAATEDYTHEIASHYSLMTDDYLAQRASDFKIIGSKVIYALNKFESRIPDSLPDNSVVIADELGPIEMMQLIKLSPAAIIVENCGQYSHTAIIASGANIPILSSSLDLHQRLQNGTSLIYDYFTNKFIIEPTEQEIKELLKQRPHSNIIKLLEPPFYYNHNPVIISANIEPPENPELAKKVNAQGFGLIRTEFLFFQTLYLPTEQEQYDALEKICQTVDVSQPITIRTPDFGGDKTPASSRIFDDYKGVLSLRGVGLTLKHPELLIPNLRAILRLSEKYPNIRILLPMVKISQHIIDIKKILNQVKETLIQEKLLHKKQQIPPIGAMIEVPSAAICADLLALHCDFFSIGSNDLVQFAMAADRNDTTQEEYFINHPEAIFRLIENTFEASKKQKFQLSMCGDFRNRNFLNHLLTMGIRHFSTAIHQVQDVATLVQDIDKDNMQPSDIAV